MLKMKSGLPELVEIVVVVSRHKTCQTGFSLVLDGVMTR